MGENGALRAVVIAGLALAALFAVAVLTQPRPFFWDTYRPDSSLVEFQEHRWFLMNGAWVRAAMLPALVVLAVGLRAVLEEAHTLAARAGALLMAGSGVLYAASGAVGAVMGVPAESYRPAEPGAYAVEVLADSLYWVQDNLATMALVALGGAMAVFSVAMSRDTASVRFPRRLAPLGLAALPVTASVPASFYLRGDRQASPVYVAALAASVAVVLSWVVGVALAARAAAHTGE